jgi:hypothetical protein
LLEISTGSRSTWANIGNFEIDLESLSSMLVPTAVANASSRKRLRRDFEQGIVRLRARETFQACDTDGAGVLMWNTGAIRSFIGQVFFICALTPPPEHQLYDLYTKFDLNERLGLNASECICLVEAIICGLLSVDVELLSAPQSILAGRPRQGSWRCARIVFAQWALVVHLLRRRAHKVKDRLLYLCDIHRSRIEAEWRNRSLKLQEKSFLAWCLVVTREQDRFHRRARSLEVATHAFNKFEFLVSRNLRKSAFNVWHLSSCQKNVELLLDDGLSLESQLQSMQQQLHNVTETLSREIETKEELAAQLHESQRHMSKLTESQWVVLAQLEQKATGTSWWESPQKGRKESSMLAMARRK